MSIALFDERLLPTTLPAPEGLRLRPLRNDDYGYLKVLSQLTSVGDVSKEDFQQRFASMKKANSYYVVVIEDEKTSEIVGAATLVIEFKFIHSAGSRGRVEDVVVDESMRGKKLGVLLNRVLVEMARAIGVYKLSLECKTELKTFYAKFGYEENLHFMVQRFDEPVALIQ